MSPIRHSVLAGTLLIAGIVLYMGGAVQAQGIVKLSPETIAEFDAYVKDGERLLQKRVDALPIPRRQKALCCDTVSHANPGRPHSRRPNGIPSCRAPV